MADLKNDIEKYLRGKLSSAERHALEKKALHDPFLAEALEGTENISPDQFTDDLKNLEASIQNRVQQKTTIVPMWVWPARIAAGLLVLVVATYLLITVAEKSQQNKNLALHEDQGSAPVSEKDTILINSPKAEQDDQPYISMAKPAEEPTTKVSKRAVENIDPSPTLRAEETEAEKETKIVEAKDGVTVADDMAEDKKLTQGEIQPVISSASKSEELASTSKAKKEIETRAAGAAPAATQQALDKDSDIKSLIRGRVIDAQDGSGLPGVNVVMKGTNTGTITDAEGNYQISIPATEASLVFSFIGLQSKEVAVTNNQNADVSMEPDVAQLSEVVVVGYGTEETTGEKGYSTFEMASPAGGKKAFNKYLEDKLQYPQQALENKIEGKVTIQFTVETTGQLTDFKVIKGIGYGCDEEVIRLIKTGPKWSPVKRDDEPVKGRVRVRMRFALPKK